SIVTHVSTPDTFDNYLPEAYAASGQSLLGGEEDDFWIRPNWSYIEAGNIVGKRFAFTSIAQDPGHTGKYLAWFDNPDLTTRAYVYWEGSGETGEYVLELRWIDGDISKFKNYAADQNHQFWRITSYRDRFDNQTI